MTDETYAKIIRSEATRIQSKPTVLENINNADRRLLRAFVDEVNRRAEENILKTGKLEGSHYAAMCALMDEL